MPEHWRSIRTNNPMEQINREIRRRTRVVGAFPDGHSALMLVAARLRHVAATKWGTKRYLQMNRLAEVRANARAALRLTPWGEWQNNLNPKTFLSSKEDQKCEKSSTLPGHYRSVALPNR